KVIVKYLRYVRVRYGGRGLLVACDPGMGKTRVAVAVAKEFIGVRGIKRVYMISQKSLHDNFRVNIERYFGKKAEEGKDPLNVQYYSLNASNFGDKLKDVDFEGSVVIIDEAHKFASMVVNGSPAGIKMYMDLRDAKNV